MISLMHFVWFHVFIWSSSHLRTIFSPYLGRNRELQGLAMAMIKLWESSAIAKIAIKRGVLNTCNERMAEELKVKDRITY